MFAFLMHIADRYSKRYWKGIGLQNPNIGYRLDFNYFPTNPTMGYTDWSDIRSHNFNNEIEFFFIK